MAPTRVSQSTRPRLALVLVAALSGAVALRVPAAVRPNMGHVSAPAGAPLALVRRELAQRVAVVAAAALGASVICTRPAWADEEPEGASTAPTLDPATDSIPVSDVCFLDFAIDGSPAGRVLIELYGSVVPRTAQNFKELAKGSPGYGYAGTQVFRVIDGFTIQAGDVVKGDGTSGKSIYGASFERENFKIKHTVPGMVSMINNRDAGPDSRFVIDTRPGGSGYLDDKYVAFGRVVDGMDVINRLERLPTRGTKNAPRSAVVITASGVLEPGSLPKGRTAAGDSGARANPGSSKMVIGALSR